MKEGKSLYIARQAILNRSLKVFGYELLYRGEIKSNQYDGFSSKQASASVLGGLFENGINHIVDDKYAFVNFDEEFIFSDSIELISPKQLVIEVLENVVIDDALVGRVKDLKKKGYKIALDDFNSDPNSYLLTPDSNIIKYDINATPLNTITESVKAALAGKKVLLAEKIETEEQFIQAKKMGFHLFQDT